MMNCLIDTNYIPNGYQEGKVIEIGLGMSITYAMGISPMYVNTGSVSIDLAFEKDLAYCYGRVFGNANVTKITATATLYKNVNGNMTVVKTWSGLETSGTILNISEKYYVPRGYPYRLKFEIFVYVGTSCEFVSIYTDNYCD